MFEDKQMSKKEGNCLTKQVQARTKEVNKGYLLDALCRVNDGSGKV